MWVRWLGRAQRLTQDVACVPVADGGVVAVVADHDH
jgi:hypothetical protein